LCNTELFDTSTQRISMNKFIASLGASVLATACASYSAGPTATARLQATQGNAVSGLVQFTQRGDKVLVTGEIAGLRPHAEHGFHIHDKGDCSSGDGMSAGGHFNPNAKAHGAHEHSEHHAGDMVSLKADATGVAKFSYESTGISVGSGATDVVGRGLIVHRDADDFKTQPTGNSGPRLACAVIVKA
jgi:Cu-Zn family superoxide dismutase